MKGIHLADVDLKPHQPPLFEDAEASPAESTDTERQADLPQPDPEKP